jgi:hypothetical protein
MADILQVQNKTVIRDAEFVRITLPSGTVYGLSTSYKTETFNSTGFVTNFTPLGALVSISQQQRDLSATSFDTNIALAGVDQTQIGTIIDAGIKGGKVEMWRGFYDVDYQLISTPVLRFTGIITGYVIDENFGDMTDTFVLSLHCSSFKRVLETRIAGRFTNKNSWQNFYPNDKSMNNVAALANVRYDFGKKLA